MKNKKKYKKTLRFFSFFFTASVFRKVLKSMNISYAILKTKLKTPRKETLTEL